MSAYKSNSRKRGRKASKTFSNASDTGWYDLEILKKNDEEEENQRRRDHQEEPSEIRGTELNNVSEVQQQSTEFQENGGL